MQNFELLGKFYLGFPVEPSTRAVQETPLLYDSKDLVTHAVCVGMTGSGKTGLCIGLLEEAAIDGIPAIVIDPKGDLANLMLTFPQLAAGDFRPWINEDDARTKGISPDDFAAQQADLWKTGLAKFGQDGARIQKLKDAVEFSIYTPGSEAGRPISVLNSLNAPPAAVKNDREAWTDRIESTATSLLGLLGIDADPIQSREHVLLSNILDTCWRAGQDLDLAALIGQVQTPGFRKVGVMDLETFFPEKERFKLAMSLNNLLASPGFQAWMQGEPLDPGSLLYTAAGKPRISILSIAHLRDSERMFFVSLLLNQTLGWMRSQSGTTSLRALLYMDEIFGYFPPVANPPSKKPLLTLLKQARAFGLGIVLASQNPVDLDYKGLSNTGTWFIGRLQTERDKMRLLDGLQGAAGDAGTHFDRAQMDQILSSLGNRVFLMNNVHEDHPVLFQTRWTLSYLRGPMTLDQIRTVDQAKPGPTAMAAKPAASATAPVLPPDIPQYFVPTRSAGLVTYKPMLLGAAKVQFTDPKKGIDQTIDCVFTAPITDSPAGVDWSAAREASCTVEELEKEPAGGSGFEELPAAAAKVKSYATWNRAFQTWLYQTQKLDLLRSGALDTMSKPGESERDFRIRLQQAAREERDRIASELHQKYAPKFDSLNERKRRAMAAEEEQKAQRNEAMLSSAVSIGTSILGAFLGRKTSATQLTRAAKAAGRTWKESQDVGIAEESVQAVDAQLQQLQQQFAADLQAQQGRVDPATEVFETISIRPKKTNIAVQLVALVWSEPVQAG